MLYVEPQTGARPVVQLILAARRSVDINAYLIDDRSVLDAIRSDTRRGIRVRVVLSPNPYHARGAAIQREFNALAGAGAQIRWSPPRFDHRFAYDHAKYIVVDGGEGETLIGTANFTYSAFHDNREYLWISRNRAVAKALEAVFSADWNRRRAGPAPRKLADLVISPGGEKALLKVIDQPGSIDLESEEFGYLPRISKAFEHKGRLASIIVPNTLDAYDLGNLQPLRRDGVNVRFIKHPHMHAKMIVGDRLAFIGSQNISWTSLHHNREIGIILRGQAVVTLRKQFDHDWRNASATR